MRNLLFGDEEKQILRFAQDDSRSKMSSLTHYLLLRIAAICTRMLYYMGMPASGKAVRTSVSLAPKLARRVRQMAKASRASTNKVLVGLIEQGIEAREQEKRRFFDVAERLAASEDPSEQQALKKELARMTFGS